MSLRDRRTLSDLLFLYKIVGGFTDCSEILSLIKFNVTARSLRGFKPFNVNFHRTLYGRFNPINRLSMLANDLDCVDFHYKTIFTFKNTVISCINSSAS